MTQAKRMSRPPRHAAPSPGSAPESTVTALPPKPAGASRGPRLPGYADMLGWALAVAGPLALYVVTMPRTVVLEDDGWFLMVDKFLGVGHPPGYPVHTLLANLFLKIPWGSPALLGHLLSAILGALACGAVYICARLLGAAAAPALIGAWLFAVSEHFWAQAIITEVYTLNALLFFSIFALCLYLRRNPSDTRAWFAAAFMYGLSLANHWPLMMLATPGLTLAVLPIWRHLRARLRLVTGAFLPAVVLPYGWMVWRSLQEPAISFTGPLDTLDGIVAHITRRAYSNLDPGAPSGWSDRLEFLRWFGTDIVRQLTLPGFLLALAGLAVLLAPSPWKRRGARRIHDVLDWMGRYASPAVFIGHSVVLVWLLDFDYDFFTRQILRAFPLVCYGLLAIWAAVGLQHATSWTDRRLGWSVRRHPLMLAGLAATAGVAMVAWSVSAHWKANNRSGADFASRYVDMVFEVLPPDAVLMTIGDHKTMPAGYYHLVEGRRPDLRLVEMQGLGFETNLYLPVIHTTEKAQQQALRAFLAQTERPVFHTYRTYPIDHGRAVRDYGFLREVLGEDVPADEIGLRPDEAAEAYFVSLFEGEYHDGWELVSRNNHVRDYSQYLGYALLSGSPELIERTAPLRELAAQDYYGLIAMASVLAELGDAQQLEQAMTWLEMAELRRDAALTKQAEADLYTNMGAVLWWQGHTDAAISMFEQSRDTFPHPDNPAVQHLEQLGL